MSCCTGTMERTRRWQRGRPSFGQQSSYTQWWRRIHVRTSTWASSSTSTALVQSTITSRWALPPKKNWRSASRNHRRRCNKVEVQQEEGEKAVHKLFPTLELELLTVWVCCTPRRWFRCCCRSPGLQSVMIRAVLYTSIRGRSTSFSCSMQSPVA